MDDKELMATIEDRSARGIAAAVGRLIHTGVLQTGARLPTVRTVAQHLGVSPATVSEAWRALATSGAIEARGRAGTFVRAQGGGHGPERYQRITRGPGVYARDLSTGIPDPSLLPDLTRAQARTEPGDLTTNYFDGPVDPALADVLFERWPFPAEAITVVDGCLDALDRVTAAVVRFGDRVLVENPTFPPLLDMLGGLGAEVVPVALDADGPVPDSLAQGIAQGATAFLFQPRAHNPTGLCLRADRVDELADILEGTEVTVIEDDHAGDSSSGAWRSLGARLPRQTVHVAGFSKSHGPDLRLAAVGGAGDVIDAVVARRRLGPGWSSRILQRLLATMLTDPVTIDVVARAADTYQERRAALAGALAERGVATDGADGIYLWVPVRDEQAALVSLASQGIGASPGSPFEAAPLDQDHVRVTAGLVAEAEVDNLANALATAADAPPPVHRRR